MNKRVQYLDLIERVKKTYGERIEDDDRYPLAWYEPCKEINLWTYWQGYGYADNIPEIEILLVGQDWGNPFPPNPYKAVKNIEIMNHGSRKEKEQICYFDQVDMTKKEAQTDHNLITLFAEIGYPDIDKKSYKELFFTNFALGYRRNGSSSYGIKKGVLLKDRRFFQELCEILEPSIIICLGRMTYEAVLKAFGKDDNITDIYNHFIASDENQVITKIGRKETRIYGVAHCGYYGTRNRGDIPFSKNNEGNLTNQISDWKKIMDRSYTK